MSDLAFDTETADRDYAGEGRSIVVIRTDGGYNRRHMRLTTSNGWDFSAIWGFGAYCNNARLGGFDAGADASHRSMDAEIMVWKGDKTLEIGGDTVSGWVSPERFTQAVEAAERDDEEAIREALAQRVNA